MDIGETVYGKNILLRGRGTVGTSQINLNPLSISLLWSSVFNIAYALDVSSSSASDDGDPVGTGARVIRIIGLDKNYNRQYEDVTMNGQTKVTTTKTFLRVFALFVKTAGTAKTNVGDIYVIKTGTGGSYVDGVPPTLTSGALKALAGDGLAFSGLFTVPAGCSYAAKEVFATARAQAGTIIVNRGNASLSSFAGPYAVLKAEVSNDAAFSGGAGIIFNPKDDVYFQAFAAAAGGIINCTMGLEQISGPGIARE